MTNRSVKNWTTKREDRQNETNTETVYTTDDNKRELFEVKGDKLFHITSYMMLNLKQAAELRDALTDALTDPLVKAILESEQK